MKRKTVITFLCTLALTSIAQRELVKENFNFAAKQLKFAQVEVELAKRNETDASKAERARNNWGPLVSPRSLNPDGTLRLEPSKDWCSGFFPGELWYMYEYTKDSYWRGVADAATIVLEREKLNDRTHDMGFKIYCSYGNAYRLTADIRYREVMIEAANTLITRFNPAVGCLKSWDFGQNNGWQFPVIIDNMMNLELLFWATRATGDNRYRDIAISHANTTLKNHFRDDNSSYHVIDYDPVTGEVRHRHTHQGYSHSSAWARGQGWGLYGYTMMYRETKDERYLEQAQKIYHYMYTHPNMPSDLVPYWDFNAPDIPIAPRDVSAATLCASALYELSLYDAKNAPQYIAKANLTLKNVTQYYRAPLGSNCGFLTVQSVGAYPVNSEVTVPLVYADYYFLEALLRKQKIDRGSKNLF